MNKMKKFLFILFTIILGIQELAGAQATSITVGGSATAITLGANSGTLTIGNPTVVGTQTTQNVFNTTATTVNAFGAATTLTIGTTTVNSSLVNASAINVVNQTNTATLYVTASANVGTALTVKTSSAGLLYKPSTGELQADVITVMNGIIVNSKTVSANITIPVGYSAMSSGPITVANNVSVTVSSGSRWVIV